MDSLRRDNFLTDFIINNRGKNFKCHKVILAGSSDYFHGLLSSNMAEAIKGEVNFDFDTKNLEKIIEYIYKDEISINDENIKDLVEMSRYLQMKKLIPLCNDYLMEHLKKNPNSDNLDLIYSYNMDLTAKEIMKSVESKFSLIFSETLEKYVFLRLNSEDLKNYIIENKFSSKKDEYDLVKALKLWCVYDIEERVNCINELLNLIDCRICSKQSVMDNKNVDTGNQILDNFIKQLHLQIVILSNNTTIDLISFYKLKHINTIIIN